MVPGRPDVRHVDRGPALHSREQEEDHREDPQGQAQPAALPHSGRQGPHQEAAQETDISGNLFLLVRVGDSYFDIGYWKYV